MTEKRKEYIYVTYFEADSARVPASLRAVDAAGSETAEVHSPQLMMADVVEKDTMKNYHTASERIHPETGRFPYCVVWTPIPVLSWVNLRWAKPRDMAPSDSSTSLA